jgi:hypothetical protein
MAQTSLYALDDFSHESLFDHHIDNPAYAKKDVVATPPNASKRLIGEAFQARINQIDADSCAVGDEDAFYVADLGQVYRQHLRWKANLGRVIPHYGKCLKVANIANSRSRQMQPRCQRPSFACHLGSRIRCCFQGRNGRGLVSWSQPNTPYICPALQNQVSLALRRLARNHSNDV